MLHRMFELTHNIIRIGIEESVAFLGKVRKPVCLSLFRPREGGGERERERERERETAREREREREREGVCVCKGGGSIIKECLYMNEPATKNFVV